MNSRIFQLSCLTICSLLFVAGDAFAQRFGGRGGGYRGGGGGGYRSGSVYRGGGTVVGPSRTTTTTRSRSSYYRPATRTGSSRTTTTTPFSTSTSGTKGFSHTTKGGYTISGGAGAGKTTGPRGGTTGGVAKGVQVSTPGGQTYTRGGTQRATVGPEGGVAVGGSRVRGTTGPGGTAVQARRGGAARGPGGATVGSVKGGSAFRFPTDAGLARYSKTTVARGRSGTVYRSTTAVRTQAATVRTSWRRGYATTLPAYTSRWYARYPRAWRAARWTTASVFAAATWGTLASYCSYPSEPVYYDYGSNVVYQGDTVYVQGESAGTTTEYAAQAAKIAEQGAAAKQAEKEQWQTLGVFAMVQGEEKNANQIIQLAVNKEGIIRGNYYNALTDTTVSLQGSVDKKSQRAAWTIADKKTPVYEAGIANFTKEETSMLVHFGQNNTQQWLLVRLEEPKEKKNGGALSP